jgi:hypothetical protein
VCDEPGDLHVDYARGDLMPWDGNPEMLVFDEFLWECHAHPHMHPGSKLTLNFHRQTDHETCRGEAAMCYWGSILNDGEHIYRIGEYANEVNSWHARWPD